MDTDELPEEPSKALVPANRPAFYEFTHEDVCEMLMRIKRDIQLVCDSVIYGQIYKSHLTLDDAIKLAEHTWSQVVIHGMKAGKLDWKAGD